MLPPNPLNFRAAIMESEALDYEDSSTKFATLATALGCNSSEDQLACVRADSVVDIINFIDGHGLLFSSAIDNITMTDTVDAIVESGNFARVPVIIGTNGDEGSVFLALDELSGSLKKRVVQKERISKRQVPTVAAPNATGAELVTLADFQCPDSNLTQLLVSQGVSVHRYFYNASFPNNIPFPGAGAFHTSEMPEVFGTFDQTQATSAQISISSFMNRAWADFVKNPYVDPASDWPRFSNTSQSNILNIQDSGISALLSSDRLDAVCKVIS
jgi:carboxylesterase type B